MASVDASSTTAPARTSGALVRSILVAGLILGIVGGLDYTLFYYLTLHEAPVAVFQYIASGLLGRSAFAGGVTTALLGFVLHFAISFVVAAVFILAAHQSAFLRRTVFLSAMVYGAAVNLFMSLVVLPHSAAPHRPSTTVMLVHGIIGDAVFVGLPIAITVWRTTRATKVSAASKVAVAA